MRTASVDGTVVLYNAGGERRRRSTSVGTDFFLGAGFQLDGSGRETISVSVAGELAGTYKDGGVIWTQAVDHLGSPVYEHASAAASGVTRRYTPFGMPRPATVVPGQASDVGFTGQRLDAGTGLMYYGARYYDPQLGQFAQPDPLTVDGLNRYAYVRNNPIRFTDPSGLCSTWNSEEGCVTYGNGWTYRSSSGVVNHKTHQEYYSSQTDLDPVMPGRQTRSDLADPLYDPPFGLDGHLLMELNDKETRDPLEWGAMLLNYPFGVGSTYGQFNIGTPVAKDVWGKHGEEIEAHFAETVPLEGDPMGNWPEYAENVELSGIIAGLHIRDLEEKWATLLVGDLANEVTPKQAALLRYRYRQETVEGFIFDGIDEVGVANDLAEWNRRLSGS